MTEPEPKVVSARRSRGAVASLTAAVVGISVNCVAALLGAPVIALLPVTVSAGVIALVKARRARLEFDADSELTGQKLALAGTLLGMLVNEPPRRAPRVAARLPGRS